jgi:hypothetical protein
VRIIQNLEGVSSPLNQELLEELFEGFKVREENFGKKVYFYSPWL